MPLKPLYSLRLIGPALLVGLGSIVYIRQQKTIRRLIRQKTTAVEKAQQLERLNQTKDRLFLLISHDLRSPVIRLKQQLYSLRTTRSSVASIREQLYRSEEQVDQLTSMLTNLLDWSAVQLKGIQPNPQPVDLSILLAEALADLSSQVKHKQISLINQVNGSTWVVADRYQLICVLRNLINNAIKFTPSTGYVRLFIKAIADTYATLAIQDTGVGMDADQLARLTQDPVIRAGTQGEPGTGLGLQLCREFLGDDSDALQIVSWPGRGTTVTIRLATTSKPVC